MAIEMTPWRTVGGSNGQSPGNYPNVWEIQSPWDTPAFFVLDQVSGNSAGLVVITFESEVEADAYGASIIIGAPQPGIKAMIMRIAANSPVTFAPNPIRVDGRRVYVYTSTDTANKAIYVTGHWVRSAPIAGSYEHSDQTLAATMGLVPSDEQIAEAEQQWMDNLVMDNSSASRQSFKRQSPLRRSTASRKPSLLAEILNK